MKSVIRSTATKARIPAFIGVLFLGYELTLAEPGSVDPSFSPQFDGSKQIDSLTVQADGKILIARDILSRGLGLPLGSLDPAFVPAPARSLKAQFPLIHAVAVQGDGKVLVGGEFSLVGAVPRTAIARLNVDGSVDPSFLAALSGDVGFIAVQGNGRIVVTSNGVFPNIHPTSSLKPPDTVAQSGCAGPLRRPCS